jgi:hypothetical protein
MSTEARSMSCGDCGEPLLPGQTAPCHKCGSMKRAWSLLLATETKPVASLDLTAEQHGREWNWIALGFMVAFTLGSGLVGLWVSGLAGVVIGLILGVLGSLIWFKALTLTKTITKQHV